MSLKGAVVTLMSPIGEYVGRLDRIEDGNVYLTNPRLIVKGPDGQIGFGRGVCMSAEEQPKEVMFTESIFVAKTNDDFEKSWIEATSGIIV